MKRLRVIVPVLLVLMLMAATVWAQPMPSRLIAEGEEVIKSWVAGEFFFALVVGVVLAIAFQLLLTNVTVAAGLTAAKALTEEDDEDRRKRDERRRSEHHHEHHERDSSHKAVRKVSSVFGIWSLITASISLFFATWLAVELVPHFYLIYGIVIGLTIWGLFYLTMMVLEMKAVSSLVGTLGSMASSALKGSGEAVKTIFTKSPEARLGAAGRELAVAVREEILQNHKVQDQLEDYLRQLKPPDMSPQKLRKELEKLLDHLEIEAIVKDEGLDTEKITAWLKSGGVHADDAVKAGRTLKHAISSIRDEMQSGKRPADKAFDATLEAGGMGREEAEKMRARLEEYLSGLHDAQLDPEALKTDIETMFHDPRAGAGALGHRLAAIDHDTLATLVADRTSLSHDRARQVVETILKVRDRLMGTTRAAEAAAAGMPDEIRHRAETKIQRYMDSLHRPELQYAGVRDDVKKLFHDPRAGADALLNRVRRMDRETLKAILISLPHMNHERAEHVLDEVDKARHEIIAKGEKIRDEIERHLEDARREAMHQADQARKTAANIAWWAFATFLVSGGAAVLGGIVAMHV